MLDDARGHRMVKNRSGPPTLSTSRTPVGPALAGVLLEHGQARYQFRSDQEQSYYVKVRTDDGVRVAWGADLKRAIEESKTKAKVGDKVVVERVGSKPTSTDRRMTIWRVEEASYAPDRAREARRARDLLMDEQATLRAHPELRSTYLNLRAMETMAERRIRDPAERERLLAVVKEAIEASNRNGVPLPTVRMRVREKNAPAKDKTPVSPTKKPDDRTR
jgi:hypothetical protein